MAEPSEWAMRKSIALSAGGGMTMHRVAAELDAARREAIEECAKVAESETGGFTVMIRCPGDDPYEGQEIACHDEDGPWVLNSNTAAKIRALLDDEPNT